VRRGIAYVFVRAPYGIYETADGHITISNVPLENVAEVFGLASLVEYDDSTAVFENRDEIKSIIENYTRQHPSDQLLDDLLERTFGPRRFRTTTTSWTIRR